MDNDEKIVFEKENGDYIPGNIGDIRDVIISLGKGAHN